MHQLLDVRALEHLFNIHRSLPLNRLLDYVDSPCRSLYAASAAVNQASVAHHLNKALHVTTNGGRLVKNGGT